MESKTQQHLDGAYTKIALLPYSASPGFFSKHAWSKRSFKRLRGQIKQVTANTRPKFFTVFSMCKSLSNTAAA